MIRIYVDSTSLYVKHQPSYVKLYSNIYATSPHFTQTVRRCEKWKGEDINLPVKCSNGIPMRLSCLVNCDVGNVASSITSQNMFGMCFRVYPNRVISATCSGRLYVGVIMYRGGGRILNKKLVLRNCLKGSGGGIRVL